MNGRITSGSVTLQYSATQYDRELPVLTIRTYPGGLTLVRVPVANEWRLPGKQGIKAIEAIVKREAARLDSR